MTVHISPAYVRIFDTALRAWKRSILGLILLVKGYYGQYFIDIQDSNPYAYLFVDLKSYLCKLALRLVVRKNGVAIIKIIPKF